MGEDVGEGSSPHDSEKWVEMLINILAQYQPFERDALFRYYTSKQAEPEIEREFNMPSGTLKTLRGEVRHAFFDIMGHKS